MAIDALSVAKLVIYLVLVQPATYVLIKHGKPGLLGWLFLQVFCILRIVTDGMTINPNNSSTATLILSSIGMAPLLFSCAGVLHEARLARNPQISPKMEWFLQIQYHMLISTATILVVVGVVNLENNGPTSLSDTLLKAGAGVIALGWLVLAGWSLFSLRSHAAVDSPTYTGGTTLLYGVIVALPFNGLRLAYAVTSLLLEDKHPTSGFLTSTAVTVCLSVVPEILTTLILLVAGIRTRELKTTFKKTWRLGPQPVPRRS